MFISKLNQLIASQKTTLVIRAAILTAVVLTTLIGTAPAFADPGSDIFGG